MKRCFCLIILVVAVMASLETGCTPATFSPDSATPPTPSPSPTCIPCLPRSSPIHLALWEGDIETALALLEENPDLVRLQDDRYEETPLHMAAQRDYIQVVQWLVEHGADVNATAYNGFTPLHLTTNGTIARILIEHGANLDQVDNLGNTPLQSAAFQGCDEVVEAILESGYPMDLRTALMLGEREYALELVQEDSSLLTNQIEGWSLWGDTSPLGLAASLGDLEMVELFLARGAPVDSTTYMPMRGSATPLTNAVWGGHKEIVRTLCAYGADPNIASGGKYYRTIMDYAIVYSEPEMIWILVECGARPSEEVWQHIAHRFVNIVRERWLVLLIVGILTGSVIAVVVINRRRNKSGSLTSA
jgi:hypothetical protein